MSEQDERALSSYAFSEYGGDARLYNGIHDLESTNAALAAECERLKQRLKAQAESVDRWRTAGMKAGYVFSEGVGGCAVEHDPEFAAAIWSAGLQSDLDDARAECERLRAALEDRVAEWVRTRIGPEHMQPSERAMRLLEEAAELGQAEGLTEEQVHKQVGYVYSRPVGEPSQEAAGVAVCLLGWCAATGNRLMALALREIERIEAKPIEQIRGSLARKADKDLVVAARKESA